MGENDDFSRVETKKVVDMTTKRLHFSLNMLVNHEMNTD